MADGDAHAAPAIRRLVAADGPAVLAIYAEGIATRLATFETEPPTWEAFAAARLPEHRLVACVEGAVAGWATLSATSGRCVYRGVAEGSVYVGAAHRGRGVGRLLLDRLVADAEAAGIWTVEAGMFPENVASIRLHHACGFRTVGLRERLGRLDGVWRDVLLLERRSAAI